MLPIVTSTPFDQARANGESYIPAAGAGGIWLWSVIWGILSSLFIFPPLLVIGAIVGTALFMKRFSGEQQWWIGIQRLTIRRAACALADNLPEREYDQSPRAQALGEELLSLVNHGHMPLAGERVTLTNIGATIDAVAGRRPHVGSYGAKNRTINALISVRTLNDFARGRNLTLPWTIPPKKEGK